jgi:hypothetical protein
MSLILSSVMELYCKRNPSIYFEINKGLIFLKFFEGFFKTLNDKSLKHTNDKKHRVL